MKKIIFLLLVSFSLTQLHAQKSYFACYNVEVSNDGVSDFAAAFPSVFRFWIEMILLAMRAPAGLIAVFRAMYRGGRALMESSFSCCHRTCLSVCLHASNLTVQC